MIQILASEKGFDEIFLRATLIAQYTNPQLFYDLRDMPEEERLRELDKAKNEMEELIS